MRDPRIAKRVPPDHSRPYGKSPQTLQEPLEQTPRGGHTLTSPADPTRSRTSPCSPPRRRGATPDPARPYPAPRSGAGAGGERHRLRGGQGRRGSRAWPRCRAHASGAAPRQPPPGLGALLAAERNGSVYRSEAPLQFQKIFLRRQERWQQLSGLNSNNTCSEIKEAWLCVGVGFYMRIECLLTVSSKPKKHLLGFLRC